MKVRYGFLDGMRAIVCLFVFFGHYFVDFCITDIFPMNSPVYRVCLLVFYGCYTVPLFCAVSGFLAVRKEIGKGWQLVLAAVNRFLRFELPLFFLMAVILYPLIGLLSCPMIYALWDRLPYVPLILLSFAATSAACLLLAFAYNRVIERPCYAVIKKVIGFLGEN